ncbi:hypothetical protein M0811_00828 [Anaeramoeba ignava]|uniref:Uncharacterized protein n=1 Tax=Anaeramoeba ignava TaxID=1746090 RepID=A0A9Q0RBK9_ANAIG|nr:hypothetical protein M0811_00828 [Anaeramoeba ignava]
MLVSNHILRFIAIGCVLGAAVFDVISLGTHGLFYFKYTGGSADFHFGNFESGCSGSDCPSDSSLKICDWAGDLNLFKGTLANGFLCVAGFFLLLNSLLFINKEGNAFFFSLLGSLCVISGYGSFRTFFKNSDYYDSLKDAEDMGIITWGYGANTTLESLSFIAGLVGSVIFLLLFIMRIKSEGFSSYFSSSPSLSSSPTPSDNQGKYRNF